MKKKNKKAKHKLGSTFKSQGLVDSSPRLFTSDCHVAFSGNGVGRDYLRAKPEEVDSLAEPASASTNKPHILVVAVMEHDSSERAAL